MKKCFLIDDDAVFNLISSKMILRTGMELETKTFVSAKLAIEEIREMSNQKEISPLCIFLDIRMPDMDGFSFLNELKKMPLQLQKMLHVYILSSSLDQRDIVRSMSFELVKGFLTKPLEEAAVSKIMNEIDKQQIN